ncbi:0d7afd07-3174-4cfd-a50b-d1858e99309c [Thermothielavioides terrestris]|uniref:0d7afd07-3174-4cfd-a50b-d1858e99309c n=1 Tax=Thermothielavioides terrestris TaxID=2587410 RepID=A0A446BQ52_9PEZI|nr:0d7afd07-3174-4cfd-a50b-d1858e99309c [Thermothielavioides terrestris]
MTMEVESIASTFAIVGSPPTSSMDVDGPVSTFEIVGSPTTSMDVDTPVAAPGSPSRRLPDDPLRGCLKTPGKRRAGWLFTRFDPNARCVITGDVVPAHLRDRAEWAAAILSRIERRRAMQALGDRDRQEPPVEWEPSSCDEPMTGVSEEDDALAMRSRAEEAELDRRLELAALIAIANSAR